MKICKFLIIVHFFYNPLASPIIKFKNLRADYFLDCFWHALINLTPCSVRSHIGWLGGVLLAGSENLSTTHCCGCHLWLQFKSSIQIRRISSENILIWLHLQLYPDRCINLTKNLTSSLSALRELFLPRDSSMPSLYRVLLIKVSSEACFLLISSSLGLVSRFNMIRNFEYLWIAVQENDKTLISFSNKSWWDSPTDAYGSESYNSASPINSHLV